ncbi:MAG: hypothetical protein ACR2QC_06140, partial [Gammaproteobacteria bacterium]
MILRVFRALAVLFAAVLATIPANAQEAEMQVYTASHGDFPIRSSSVDLGSIPLSGASVLDIIASGQAIDSSLGANLFIVSGRPCQSLDTRGLPVCSLSAGTGTVTLSAGDVVQLDAPLGVPSFATTRVYSDGSATDGSELHLAFGEVPVTLASSVPQGGTLFFIDGGTFMTTQTPSTENIGFTELMESDCLGDREPVDGGLRCELQCAANQVEDGDNCRLPRDNTECMRIDAAQPMYDEREADNCRAADTTPPTDPPPPEDEQEPTPPSAATPAAASQKDEADYATG